MKVNVVVEIYRGLVSDVSVFKSDESAVRHIKKKLVELGRIKHGEKISMDRLLDLISDTITDSSDDEIHWHVVTVNRRNK